MSTTRASTAASVQLRTVPISAIVPIEGWNPRVAFDDAELQALSASMLERGCLVPVRVQALGDGSYRLVDGEKRYKAAVLAALMELPAIVRPAGAMGDTEAEEAEEAELLVDAVVANQLRSQLSLVEEALACRRLKTDHGLTLKGIAQKLQMTQTKVRERLQILELPEALWARVGAGEIPASAISGLVGLTKIHPGLAEVAVTLVLDRGDVYDAEPWRWRDVADDALSVVAGGLHDETVDAPPRVFVSSQRYALSDFTLDAKHQAAAAKLAELKGMSVDALELRFDHDAIEQARTLKAAHTPDHGWVTLIVGQDVADTIAADQVTAALKTARADAKRARDAAKASSPAAAATSSGPGGAGDVHGAVDEETRKEQARAERAAATAARERCATFNDELGTAIVNSLSPVKVDDRVVKILTAINVAERRPQPSTAHIHRQATAAAIAKGWPAPSYSTVRAIIGALDPGLLALAHDGRAAYRDRYELVYRRESERPNEQWQADHTQLDVLVLDDKGRPARPWLTVTLTTTVARSPGTSCSLRHRRRCRPRSRCATPSGARPTRRGRSAAFP